MSAYVYRRPYRRPPPRIRWNLPVVVVEITLEVQDASHTHNAENVVLTQVHAISVQDASHTHSAENVVLTQLHELVTANAAHSHTAENVTLSQVHELVVAGASHSHTAENVELTEVAAMGPKPANYQRFRADGNLSVWVD